MTKNVINYLNIKNSLLFVAAVNGECSSITPCPTPPPGYTSRCVEIGFSDHVCLCVSNIDGAELDCGIINAGGKYWKCSN